MQLTNYTLFFLLVFIVISGLFIYIFFKVKGIISNFEKKLVIMLNKNEKNFNDQHLINNKNQENIISDYQQVAKLMGELGRNTLVLNNNLIDIKSKIKYLNSQIDTNIMLEAEITKLKQVLKRYEKKSQ